MILLRIHVKLELATHRAGNISRRYLKKTKATPHYTEFSRCTLHGLNVMCQKSCDVQTSPLSSTLNWDAVEVIWRMRHDPQASATAGPAVSKWRMSTSCVRFDKHSWIWSLWHLRWAMTQPGMTELCDSFLPPIQWTLDDSQRSSPHKELGFEERVPASWFSFKLEFKSVPNSGAIWQIQSQLPILRSIISAAKKHCDGQTILRWNELEAISWLQRDMEASATTSCRFRTHKSG